MTWMGSRLSRKRRATARRRSWSPTFSRRLISVQCATRRLHLLDRLLQHVAELARLGLHGADVVERDALRRGLDQVEDVVHARDELVDVAAVDGRDEGLVQPLDHGVGDLVPLVLDRLDAGGLLLRIDAVVQHSAQERRRLARARGVLLEEVEELLAPARREEAREEALVRCGRHTRAPIAQPRSAAPAGQPAPSVARRRRAWAGDSAGGG